MILGGGSYWGSAMMFWHIGDNLPWRRRDARPLLFLEWFVIPAGAITAANVVNQPFAVLRRKMIVIWTHAPIYTTISILMFLELGAHLKPNYSGAKLCVAERGPD